MKKSRRFFLPLLLVLFFLAPTKTWADTANFSIKKIDTPEQTKEADFYDILAKPNQNTKLVTNVINASNQSATYTVTLRNGVTNNSGQIAYVSRNQSNSGQTLNKLNPAAVKVTVPANSKKDVIIPIKMPATTYSGIILGAIHVEKEMAQQKQSTKKTQIVNHYGIEIPVVVRTMPSSAPQTKLQLKK
ncbi:WxL protein peptidoglycan domain-containing protein [Latilactobacillus sakei]|uniref:WxL protein peptidoglycan domain-containing protein n=1 Tax=Latilactobacillus sakei TaxID=1599 RepID=UPI0038879A20